MMNLHKTGVNRGWGWEYQEPISRTCESYWIEEDVRQCIDRNNSKMRSQTKYVFILYNKNMFKYYIIGMVLHV